MDHTSIQSKLGKHRKKIILLIVIVAAYYVFILRNPLPSDDEMIARFYKHRDDIEELIKRYRDYPSGQGVDHSLWEMESGTRSLLKKAGVYWIAFRTPGIWPPNPYSIETAKKVQREIKSAKNEGIFHKYGALMIKFAPRNHYRSSHLRYANIWKDLLFIPEVPRVENGELLGPLNLKGEYSTRRRVLQSLDGFPDDWKDFECVYRRIEPQWFLRMCNGH